MAEFSWLADSSDETLRAALRSAVPELADLPIVRNNWDATSNPEWQSATARLDERFLVKFGWSEPTARRLVQEGRVIGALADRAADLRLPEVVGLGVDPVVVVTRLVAGQPLEYDDCGSLDATDTARVGGELGRFLAQLHAPATLDALRASNVSLQDPQPQADTDRIRTGLAPLVDPHRAEQVAAYCEWTDTVLASPRVHPDVLVHGDIHGHNQVWTTEDWTLRLVVDFETAGPAEPEFDFRYLPAQSPTLDLLLATTEVYEREAGRAVDLARVMAWNVQTVLGDALWRTEAGIGLPGGGTPTQWVDELGARLRALGFAG